MLLNRPSQAPAGLFGMPESRKIKPRALSARAGLPHSTLSKLENGKMALTYDKLIRLAQALNVD